MTWSFLLASSILVGCTTPEVQEKVVYVTRDIPTKSHPEPLTLYDVEWYVVTPENIEEFLVEYKEKTGDVVFFAISVPHYENLSLNLSEIRRYLEQQKAIILYYESRVQEDINTNTKNYSSDQE